MSAQDGHLEVVGICTNWVPKFTLKENTLWRSVPSVAEMDVVKYLIEHGADIHYNDDEPFRDAVEGGHMDVIRYMIEEAGANIYAGESSFSPRSRNRQNWAVGILTYTGQGRNQWCCHLSSHYGNLIHLNSLLRIMAALILNMRKLWRRLGDQETMKYWDI